MKIAAVVHFMLTAVVFFGGFFLLSGFPENHESLAWHNFKEQCWFGIMGFLQPQFVVFHIFKFFAHKPDWLGLVLAVISIPIWSLCFGFIFLKLKDWLGTNSKTQPKSF